MRDLFQIASVFVFMTLIAVPLSFAGEWGDEIVLPEGNAESEYATCCADILGNLHIAWQDLREGSPFPIPQVYYKRSTDAGQTWTSDERITADPATSMEPVICADYMGGVHIVWKDTRDGDYELYHKRSLDGGTTWEGDARISDDSDTSRDHFVYVDYQNDLHCVYLVRLLSGVRELHYTRSTDRGMSWHAPVRIGDSIDHDAPVLSSDFNNNLVMAYPHVDGSEFSIFSRISTDGGATWSAEQLITDSSYYQITPQLVCDMSGTFHLVYQSLENSDAMLNYRRSTDGGASWSGKVQITDSGALCSGPSLCNDYFGNLYLVWHDVRNGAGNYEIYYDYSTDGGMTWDNDLRITDDAAMSEHPSVCVDFAGNLHLVFHDTRGGFDQVYYNNFYGVTLDPVFDIKCNGLDEAVTVNSGENCTLTIECNANSWAGQGCDMWVVVEDLGSGKYYSCGPYINPTWRLGPTRALFTGALQDIPFATILDQPVAAGSYIAHFAMDNRPNSVLNVPAIMFHDLVDFVVTQ